MKNRTFEIARDFIYRNARPLDFALWRYHFENGSAQEVYDILEKYQNADGGFGYDIEPDNYNVNSNPVAVWQAIGVLNEIGVDTNSRAVQGILKYLDECKDFVDGKWCSTVKSTNNYPHAVWWDCSSESTPDDNPTVSLAGFILKYADKQSALYKKAENIARVAATKFIECPIDESHVLRCYFELLQYCEQIESFDLFDINAYKESVCKTVSETICKQPEKWFTEYVPKPSMYFDRSELLFEIVGRKLCEEEGRLIIENQQEDGAFPVTWLWHNGYKEYYVAAHKWKSILVRKNMLYLKALELI